MCSSFLLIPSGCFSDTLIRYIKSEAGLFTLVDFEPLITAHTDSSLPIKERVEEFMKILITNGVKLVSLSLLRLREKRILICARKSLPEISYGIRGSSCDSMPRCFYYARGEDCGRRIWFCESVIFNSLLGENVDCPLSHRKSFQSAALAATEAFGSHEDRLFIEAL